MIDCHKIKDTSVRFVEMAKQIQELINLTRPEILVMEGVVLQHSPASMLLLGQLQGVIMGHCYNHQIPFHIMKPSEWRKLLRFQQGSGMKREQLKQQAKDHVMKKFQIQPSEDECDAICIALAFLCQQKEK